LFDEVARSIIDYVAHNAEVAGGKTAIISDGREISFAALDDSSARCRWLFKNLGLKRGDRIALIMCDCAEWIVAFLGSIGLGAIAVPCSTMLGAAEIRLILNDCGARMAVITPDQCQLLQAALEEESVPELEVMLVAGNGALEATRVKCLSFETALASADLQPVADFEAETPALILYTSGSTGSPKGVVHSHGDIAYTIEKAGRVAYGITKADRVFSSSRLFFAYGFGNSFSFPLGLGATTVLSRERPKAERIARIFAEQRPTIFFGVPPVFRALLEYRRQGQSLDLGSLRLCVSAGEALPARLFEEWRNETGLQILDALGSTEVLQAFIANPLDRMRPGSSGLPVPGYEVRLLDEFGLTISGVGRGELYVRGGSAFSCYWNQPEKTAETKSEGWVKTGDVYRRDEAGFYWHEGRSDDMFKSKGMWVSPQEIEEALGALDVVLEAAAVPEHDSDGTNVVAAYVVLRPGLEAGQEAIDCLNAAAGARLPRYMRPERIYFVQELPRTVTGKVQRFKLRGRSGL
jgi:benzoate-CoA ligase family protein